MSVPSEPLEPDPVNTGVGMDAFYYINSFQWRSPSPTLRSNRALIQYFGKDPNETPKYL